MLLLFGGRGLRIRAVVVVALLAHCSGGGMWIERGRIYVRRGHDCRHKLLIKIKDAATRSFSVEFSTDSIQEPTLPKPKMRANENHCIDAQRALRLERETLV